MNKVHITTDKLFVFSHDDQKLTLASDEAEDLLRQLAKQLDYTTMPKSLLDLLTNPVSPADIVWPTLPSNSPCMFDDLAPGTYGISCPCPKCTMTSTSGLSHGIPHKDYLL